MLATQINPERFRSELQPHEGANVLFSARLGGTKGDRSFLNNVVITPFSELHKNPLNQNKIEIDHLWITTPTYYRPLEHGEFLAGGGKVTQYRRSDQTWDYTLGAIELFKEKQADRLPKNWYWLKYAFQENAALYCLLRLLLVVQVLFLKKTAIINRGVECAAVQLNQKQITKRAAEIKALDKFEDYLLECLFHIDLSTIFIYRDIAKVNLVKDKILKPWDFNKVNEQDNSNINQVKIAATGRLN